MSEPTEQTSPGNEKLLDDNPNPSYAAPVMDDDDVKVSEYSGPPPPELTDSADSREGFAPALTKLAAAAAAAEGAAAEEEAAEGAAAEEGAAEEGAAEGAAAEEEAAEGAAAEEEAAEGAAAEEEAEEEEKEVDSASSHVPLAEYPPHNILDVNQQSNSATIDHNESEVADGGTVDHNVSEVDDGKTVYHYVSEVDGCKTVDPNVYEVGNDPTQYPTTIHENADDEQVSESGATSALTEELEDSVESQEDSTQIHPSTQYVTTIHENADDEQVSESGAASGTELADSAEPQEDSTQIHPSTQYATTIHDDGYHEEVSESGAPSVLTEELVDSVESQEDSIKIGSSTQYASTFLDYGNDEEVSESGAASVLIGTELADSAEPQEDSTQIHPLEMPPTITRDDAEVASFHVTAVVHTPHLDIINHESESEINDQNVFELVDGGEIIDNKLSEVNHVDANNHNTELKGVIVIDHKSNLGDIDADYHYSELDVQVHANHISELHNVNSDLVARVDDGVNSINHNLFHPETNHESEVITVNGSDHSSTQLEVFGDITDKSFEVDYADGVNHNLSERDGVYGTIDLSLSKTDGVDGINYSSSEVDGDQNFDHKSQELSDVEIFSHKSEVDGVNMKCTVSNLDGAYTSEDKGSDLHSADIANHKLTELNDVDVFNGKLSELNAVNICESSSVTVETSHIPILEDQISKKETSAEVGVEEKEEEEEKSLGVGASESTSDSVEISQISITESQVQDKEVSPEEEEGGGGRRGGGRRGGGEEPLLNAEVNPIVANGTQHEKAMDAESERDVRDAIDANIRDISDVMDASLSDVMDASISDVMDASGSDVIDANDDHNEVPLSTVAQQEGIISVSTDLGEIEEALTSPEYKHGNEEDLKSLRDIDEEEKEVSAEVKPCMQERSVEIIEGDHGQAGPTFPVKYISDSSADRVGLMDCHVNPSELQELEEAKESTLEDVTVDLEGKDLEIEIDQSCVQESQCDEESNVNKFSNQGLLDEEEPEEGEVEDEREEGKEEETPYGAEQCDGLVSSVTREFPESEKPRSSSVEDNIENADHNQDFVLASLDVAVETESSTSAEKLCDEAPRLSEVEAHTDRDSVESIRTNCGQQQKATMEDASTTFQPEEVINNVNLAPVVDHTTGQYSDEVEKRIELIPYEDDDEMTKFNETKLRCGESSSNVYMCSEIPQQGEGSILMNEIMREENEVEKHIESHVSMRSFATPIYVNGREEFSEARDEQQNPLVSEESRLHNAANGDGCGRPIDENDGHILDKEEIYPKDGGKAVSGKEKARFRVKLPLLMTGIAIAAVGVAVASIGRSH